MFIEDTNNIFIVSNALERLIYFTKLNKIHLSDCLYLPIIYITKAWAINLSMYTLMQ